MSADIINKIISGYTCSTTNIQAGSIAIGSGLFNTFAVISIAWLGLNHLLHKGVDMVDANIELIKWLIYLNFFYLFIVHYQDIYNGVFSAVQEIGNSLGAKASGSPVDINPGSIINLGFQICKELLTRLITFNLFRSFAIAIVTVLAALVVMYCFVVIAVDLIIIQIGSKIILAGGIFLLAFAALPWTKEYAERYVHTFFHLGIKMIFMYILVGIGAGLARDWAQLLDTAPMNQLIESEIAVMVCAFIYYKLCAKLPDHAVSYLTGRVS
jgi:type IV secretion system protein TrbL